MPQGIKPDLAGFTSNAILVMIVTEGAPYDGQPCSDIKEVNLIKENTVTLSKKMLASFVFFCASNAVAQNPAGMDEAQLQGMLQGAAQMAACFQNLDQDKLNALAEEGKGMQAELKQLCAAGERDQAQAKAMEYGLKFMNSDEFKQLQQCGEMAKQMMPQMPDYAKYADPNSEENANRHVCDEL
jgi:hypothetical protein